MLRPWQRRVLVLGLQHDAAGALVWKRVVVTCGRQSGKTLLAVVLGMARGELGPGVFGEEQSILSLSRVVGNASRTIRKAFGWAGQQGYRTLASSGREQLDFPEGTWSVASEHGVWGTTNSLVIMDEAWSASSDLLEQTVAPTLLEKRSSQVWAISTANEMATSLVPRLRAEAVAGSTDTCLVEWSAAPGADLDDPRVWRAASAHWKPEREQSIRLASPVARQVQYLNVWPDVREDQLGGGWPVGWVDCGRALEPSPAPGGLVAVEVSADRSRYGLAAASADARGMVRLWSAGATSTGEAMGVLQRWQPAVVLAGITVADEFAGTWLVEKVGLAETRLASPQLADLIARGRLLHDHDPRTLVEVAGARVSDTEQGPVLSAKASRVAIPTVKAACWAAWAVLDGRFQPVKPKIW